MGKNLTNQEVASNILDLFTQEFENNDVRELLSKINFLIDNDRAYRIAGKSDLLYASFDFYRTCSKFIQKFNPSLKKYRREYTEREAGSLKNISVDDSKEFIEISKYTLDVGVYMVHLNKNNYLIFEVTKEPNDDYYRNYNIIFVGENWRKWKNKFMEFHNEYSSLNVREEKDFIISSTGNHEECIFKPFEQVIFKNKEKILKYIDNWINNIPLFYNKYKMISKLSIILYGKPGTGKSTFGRALANRLGVHTIKTVDSDYFGSNNSQSSRFRGSSGTVFSIDDIDCICKSREIDNNKDNNSQLSKLLAFLDNPPVFEFKASDGIYYPVSVVVASTNYYDKLDDAVKRYGRFDLKIEMDEFGKKEAEEMCKIYDLKLSDVVSDYNKKDFVISPSKLQALCLENIDKQMKNVD